MKISTKGRYALRMMVDIAQNNTGEPVSIRDISERQNISVKYLEQIVSALVRAGYLRSIRGPQGGYMLAKKPSEYTAGDILRVTEGNLHPVECLVNDVNDCPRAYTCVTLRLWKELDKAIAGVVDRYTLEDMVGWGEEMMNNYCI
ncbi:MAG: RrF2 family transcriptional regulator [Bilifractor sp.]|jgi:Rrf2 family protein